MRSYLICRFTIGFGRESYMLSVQVGSRLDGPYPSSYLVELLDGNTVIGSASSLPIVGTGNFNLVTVSGIGVGSGDLGILLEDTGVYSQTLFDDVHLESLDSPAVPEEGCNRLRNLDHRSWQKCFDRRPPSARRSAPRLPVFRWGT